MMFRQIKKRIIKIIKQNDEVAYRLKVLNLKLTMISTKFLDDQSFIRKQYKKKIGLELNLENPVTFNEKLQWIKLYYRNPLMNICVDKYAVREYVKKKLPEIGEEILIPLIGIYTDINEVDFNLLPSSFVMKLSKFHISKTAIFLV